MKATNPAPPTKETTMATTATPKIHAFNSHRTYTTKGQRIAWAELPRLPTELGYSAIHVAFYDVDRMVDGELLLLGAPGAEVTNTLLMQHYDLCNFMSRIMDQDLRLALKAAAEAL